MVNESDVDQLRAALEAAERERNRFFGEYEAMRDERDALKERADTVERELARVGESLFTSERQADALKEQVEELAEALRGATAWLDHDAMARGKAALARLDQRETEHKPLLTGKPEQARKPGRDTEALHD